MRVVAFSALQVVTIVDVGKGAWRWTQDQDFFLAATTHATCNFLDLVLF